MEISEIKSHLNITTVLAHYGLQADKNNRLCCPFHEDTTPSMQVYIKTNTVFCFSSNCSTHGKAIDCIDFIMYKENCTKHEALKKATLLIGQSTVNPIKTTDTKPLAESNYNDTMKLLQGNIKLNKGAQDYIHFRALDLKKLEIGYNTNTISHLKHCIVFGLRDKENNIVSLYGRSIHNNNDQKHFYTPDRKGLYPGYPSRDTQILIITESIIDAATFLQKSVIKSGYSVIACYGTNGLNEEIKAAIKDWGQDRSGLEIIFAFDNDEAGNTAVTKYLEEIQKLVPGAIISKFNLLCKDVNETVQTYGTDFVNQILSNKSYLSPSFLTIANTQGSFIFSNEKEKPVKSTITKQKDKMNENKVAELADKLNTSNPHNLHYKGNAADYYIKGGIRCPLDAMKISLQIVNPVTRLDYRSKVDLYEHKQVESLIKSAIEKLDLNKETTEKDLTLLTNLAESHRIQALQEQVNKNKKTVVQLPPATINECITFWESPGLITRLNELLGKSGITGEDTNRVFLFGIASSYKMPDTLHALIQGSSGSGKTRLLKIICELMPTEDTIKFTRVTDNSFYNYQEDYLINKLLGFEDIDGLKEDAMYAVRELISNEILISSTTTKTEDGQIMAMERIVRGPIASLSCTTKGSIYEDNMSRVFLIAVDESKEQTKRIIHYQQQKAAGLIDSRKEKEVKEFLQNCMRVLKPYEVINPYANKVQLPEEAHKIRRLNDLYLSFVKQITLLHQYQRRKDKRGRLISTKEDLQIANQIMFESVVLKVDELDGSLRQFFEALKVYAGNQKSNKEFILREVRQALNISKTQLHRYITDLVYLEYLEQKGHANKGYTYKISYWDNIEAIRARIKKQLDDQINKLPTEKIN